MSRAPQYIAGKDYSVAELKRLVVACGWTLESKGRTGHLLCVKNGEIPFNLPTHASKKTKHVILKRLGLK